MFFRRMFGRKGDIGEMDDDEDGGNDLDETDENDNDINWSDYEFQRSRRHSKRNGFRKIDGAATAPTVVTPTSSLGCDSAGTRHRNVATSGAASSASSSLQLTPLWEHILRTRTLPDNVCPAKMFVEFNERLRDPEWQVRQHALRVFVDVLVVMCVRADAYMEAVIPQLVENLGHPAPTVRKGALDCLRVYLAETAMPETIMLQVLDIGLNQKITNEPFGGRLTCGVMLSLPALVQSTLHTTKRHFILRATIEMLVQKMGQVTHQEITLKVLSKIRELIGEREFMEFMSHGAYREFELLCNVYGVGRCTEEQQTKSNSNAPWHYISKQAPLSCWRSSDEEQMLDCASHGKVIMETEIKINDDTLTMRILEAKEDECDELTETEESPCKLPENGYPNSLDDDVICGRLASARSEREISGVIHMLSDSEVEDNNKTSGSSDSHQNVYFSVVTPSTPSRTPKRVTFGGEVVKMRTPDSDATTSNNSSNNGNTQEEPSFETTIEDTEPKLNNTELPTGNIPASKTSELSVEITNDNTKPLSRPRIAQSPKRMQTIELPSTTDIAAGTRSAVSLPSTTTASNSPQSPIKRRDSTTSLSPRSPFKRISISPVDSIISPKTQHKEIEVLHNLQRDPSPVGVRIAKSVSQTSEIETANPPASSAAKKDNKERETPPPPKSWEDLGIVDYDTIEDLRSGNWRHRLQGILQLEDALRSTDNLYLVQAYLDSLLRTLLSSERNQEVADAKHRLLTNLISRLPLDNLENRTVQILTGLCRQGGAGANRVCKSLMQRLLPAVIVVKLTSQEFLHAKSSRFRENALQMVMYALMTHPSTSFDTETCITNATFAALNRKRRVRQAALDVLAILGQVTTTRTVMDVIERIAEETQRDDGAALVAAVKARLSRKQLPLVTADGAVQYTLRLNATHGSDSSGNGQLGPDIEWITAGVGSVSPTSLRRRAHRTRSCSKQSFCCLPPQDSCVGNFPNEGCHQKYSKGLEGSQRSYGYLDENQSYKLQHVLGNNFSLTARRTNVDFLNYKNRRLVAKSCSDSSMEGRSSDSTNTSSSGGGGNGDGTTTAAGDSGTSNNGGITGRFTRQAVNSRFPSMDLNSTYLRVHRPPVAYQPGMGAYAQLQQQQYNMSSTYPKINYNIPYQQRRRSYQPQQQVLQVPSQSYHQQQQHQKGSSLAQESFKQTETCHKQQNNAEDRDNLDGTYTICEGVPLSSNDRTSTIATKTNQQQQTNGGGSNTARRFVNVDKFMIQSNKSPPLNGHLIQTTSSPENQNHNESKQPTPGSAKSTTYSQKSTASARSAGTAGSDNSRLERGNSQESTINNEFLYSKEVSANSSAHSKFEMERENVEDQIETVEENILSSSPKEIDESHLKRSSSILSLQSKTESIKTQLEDTPPIISRAQSLKSVVIEEDIEGTDSFFVVEEIVEQELNAARAADSNSPTAKNGKESYYIDELEDEIDGETQRCISKPNTASGQRSPTIAELKTLSRRNSIIKSMESLYEHETTCTKKDSFDSVTETSSQSSNQAQQTSSSTNIPLKPQHTPLKQKSKTTYFLRNHRRVSPVKQSIKMQQAELYPTTLQRFDKPREALLKTFDQLDSANWEIIMQGLQSMVRLMRYHSDYLETQMHMVCIQLTRSVRNLRSQVARAACQAATEIFNLKSKILEQECDDLVCALLHRTADTNRFLRADATRALESMCSSLSPQKVLNILTTKGALHQNALVRTTAAKLLNGLVIRLGYEKVYAMSRENRDKFFVTGANLLLEGSLETRSYAKSLFRLLSEHPSYNRLIQEVIPRKTYRNVEKTLKSIR